MIDSAVEIESVLVIDEAAINDEVGVEDERVVVLVVDDAGVMTPRHLRAAVVQHHPNRVETRRNPSQRFPKKQRPSLERKIGKILIGKKHKI
jgi:hypothetical protein